MRAEVLLVFVGATLCCTPVCTQQVDPEEKELSRDLAWVRKAGGPLEEGQGRGKGDAELSDEPAGAVEDGKTKPKKKKTPEEIEAGMCRFPTLERKNAFRWELNQQPKT